MLSLSRPTRWIIALSISLILLGVLVVYADSYAQNVPYLDQWKHSVHVALPAQAGNATLNDIFRPFFAHINVFSNLEIIAATQFTNWNVRAWTIVNLVLGVIAWGLASTLFHRTLPEYAPVAVPLFALLLFSTAGGTSWTVSLYAFWQLNHVFLFALLWWLTEREASWVTLVGAAGFVTCMTFTVAPGIVMWIMTPLLLWLLGYRQRLYYGVWGIIAAIVIVFYASQVGVGISGDAASENALIQVRGIRRILLFAFGYLGNLNANWSAGSRIIIGAVGFVLLLLNLGWLWSHRRSWDNALPWIGLSGYVIAAIGLKSLGRTYLPDWWVPSTTLMWVAISALTLINLYDLRTNPPRRFRQRRLKLTSHYLSIAGIIGAFIWANISQWSVAHRFFYPVQFPRTAYSSIEECALQYFFSRDYSCHGPEVDTWHWGLEYPDELNAVADRQLAVYDDIQPQSVAPLTDNIAVYTHPRIASPERIQQYLFSSASPEQIRPFSGDQTLSDALWFVMPYDANLPDTLTSYTTHEEMRIYGLIIRHLRR